MDESCGEKILGQTREVAWNILDDIPLTGRPHDGAALLKAVRELLASLIKNDPEPISHLQCNINQYCARDQMIAHRDDKGDLLTTFAPAAITCLLFAPSMSDADRRNAGFVLYGDTSTQKPLRINPTNYAPFSKYVDECEKYRKDYKYGAGTLYAISGAAYERGLHAAKTSWRGDNDSLASNSFERMSLNFRVVRETAWCELNARKIRYANGLPTNGDLLKLARASQKKR